MQRWAGLLAVAALFAGTSAHAVQPDVSADTDNEIVGQRLVSMFVAGFGRGQNALKDAKLQYEAVSSKAKLDPRVEYGYGLVLMKQLRNKEATQLFQTLTRQSGADYWPAWQALIWSQLVAKDTAAGYERLIELARRLARPDPNADHSERQQVAEWIGQVVAALQKSADTLKQREAVLKLDEAVEEALTPGVGLAVSYSAGKASVHTLHSVLEDDVQKAREQTAAKQEQERVEKQAQVAKDLESSTEKRGTLKKSADEIKQQLDEQLVDLDKQLTQLERDYQAFQSRILAISASQVQINTTLSLLSTQAAAGLGPNPATFAGALALQQQRMLEVQRTTNQLQIDQTMAAAAAVSQKAAVLVRQRTTSVRQYEQLTGQLVQQDNALDKWQDRLKKDEQKLKAPATGKTPAMANKVQQVRSLRTYVDFDLEQERDRLLESFGVSMPKPAPAK